MMKKSVFLMLGVAAMLASCSQDELGSPQGEGVAVITATVGDGMQTRVPTYDGDDVTMDRCLLEVYDQGGNLVGQRHEAAAAGTDGAFTFTVSGLDPDAAYDFVFWADNKEAAAYDGDLKNRKLQAGADLTKALAFHGILDGVTPANASSVTLHHAVAKVTLKTTSALGAGDNVKLAMTDVADTWNVQAGTASGNVGLTYGYTLALNTFGSADGTEITTFYVPAPAEGANSNMTLTYTPNGSSTPGTTAINNVPLKADYRTVLCGDVASLFEGETISITATMEKAWNDQDGEIEFPVSNVIETTAAGLLTSDAVVKAAEAGNGSVVIKGPINAADLGVIAGMTDIEINLDLSSVNLMSDEGTAVTEFPAAFKFASSIAGKNSALTGIILPDGIESLTDNCFKYCKTLKTVTFPDGLKTIGQYAFDGCSSLALPDLDGVEEIGQYAFRNSAISGELIVPSSLKSAGQGCFATTKLTSVTWNSDCKVPSYAFCYCTDLKSITLETAAELDYYIANDNTSGGIQTPAFDLTCKSMTPPTIADRTFQYSTITNLYLHEEAIDNYMDNYRWAKYENVIKIIP